MPNTIPRSTLPMSMQHKEFPIEIVSKTANGGRIRINTAAVDRQRDRVLPSGARLENYLKNPVVQWGHNYTDPFATIGRTIQIMRTAEAIDVEFELRPAANEADPQNIVRLLWEGDWVRTSSVGFMPIAAKPNSGGGYDFSEWELLEWSLVPIPANQEALRLAMKSISALAEDEVAQADATLVSGDETPDAAIAGAVVASKAWMRKALIGAPQRHMHFILYEVRTVDVPDDATVLVMDNTLGECTDQPHPDRGKTIAFKRAIFVPPLSLADGDRVHAIERRDEADETLIADDHWEVAELSDIVDALPFDDEVKSVAATFGDLLPVGMLTDRVFERAVQVAKRLHRTANHGALVSEAVEEKAGRVLSKKNEDKIRAARDNLDEVLAEVESQQDDTPAEAEAAFDVVRAKHDEAALLLPCPYNCGMDTIAFTWGMYACDQCGGTFEVIPTQAGDLGAVKFPDTFEVVAVEPGDVLKGAIPPHTTPKADADTPWDAAAVLREAPNDRRVLRKIHTWVNSEGDPDAKSSYKLPHHLVDGRVVLRGVNNAKARLPQSSIPQSDQAGCEAHLNRHQKQFKAADVMQDMARALTEAATELRGETHLSEEDERALVTELRTLVTTIQEALT
jgi:hypothetical protein